MKSIATVDATPAKSLKWLEDNGIVHKVIVIEMNHLDEESLRRWYDNYD